MKRVSLLLALHNHQPVGNFDSVIDECARRAYLPALDVWREFPEIPFALHNSGALWDWLDRKSTRLNSSHIQKSRMPSSA